VTRPFSFERRWGLGNGSALLVSGLEMESHRTAHMWTVHYSGEPDLGEWTDLTEERACRKAYDERVALIREGDAEDFPDPMTEETAGDIARGFAKLGKAEVHGRLREAGVPSWPHPLRSAQRRLKRAVPKATIDFSGERAKWGGFS
jgi:hypothetical protein